MAIELLKGKFNFEHHSQYRAEELRKKIEPYLQKSKEIPSGLDLTEFYSLQKEKILHYFQATERIGKTGAGKLRTGLPVFIP